MSRRGVKKHYSIIKKKRKNTQHNRLNPSTFLSAWRQINKTHRTRRPEDVLKFGISNRKKKCENKAMNI